MGLIVLVALLVIAVMAFLQTNPHGVDRRKLLAFNVVVLASAVPAAITVGLWLYADAVLLKSGERGMSAYLAAMAGGAAVLVVVSVGGLIRNFVVFPRPRRAPAPPAK
ncbi:MAG: hypothetical protein IPP91_03370 [Betaproteobacteria bacterium]|nr:hypothetical protein [Betaproteobacteria bacterium]